MEWAIGRSGGARLYNRKSQAKQEKIMQNYDDQIQAVNQADLYSASSWDYILETQHGCYPIGAYCFLAGFNCLADALHQLKTASKHSPGLIRLVNKRRELVE